jgi:cysteine-rich repeat protein
VNLRSVVARTPPVGLVVGLLVGLLVLCGCSALVGFDQPAERGVQCSDGVDNDGNGLRDCEEPTCADVCSTACGEGIAADARAVNVADGHCYLAFSDGMPPLAANERCMILGGYLAVPDNAGEDNLIRSVAGSSAAIGIADFDESPAYDFRVVTGDRPADYLHFSSGQPDGGPGEPLCVSYDGLQSTWQDNDCTSTRPYVCEIQPQSCGDFVRQPDEGCDDGNGVSGDGCTAACVDEDECAMGTDNCSADADCSNQPWSPGAPGFSCQCRGGFVGDGVTCTALPPPPGFETREPQVLNADLPAGCTTGVPRKGHKISADPFGALYVVVLCGSDAMVTVSVDAGATWSPPQVLGSGVFEAAVVGVSPGRAVVGMVLDPSGDVVVRQTVDFGATWQPTRGVGTGADVVPGVSLATDGFDVLVGYRTTTNFFRVSRSNAADLMAFTSVDALRTFGGDVLVNPQNPAQTFAAGDDGEYHLSESFDGGHSFAPEITPFGSQTLSDWAIGGGFIFATGAGTEVTRIPVTSTGAPETVPGLVDAFGGERSIVAGPDGVAYIAYTGGGGVEVARFASATAIDPAAFIEPMTDSPAIEVVGDGLIAAVYNALGTVHFAIVIPTRPQ